MTYETATSLTSDGGFTHYMSDKSERALLEARYQAEEMEFKAHRQSLALIDLRPPKSWNPHRKITRRISEIEEGITGRDVLLP
jgi:hypothetical protein